MTCCFDIHSVLELLALILAVLCYPQSSVMIVNDHSLMHPYGLEILR